MKWLLSYYPNKYQNPNLFITDHMIDCIDCIKYTHKVCWYYQLGNEYTIHSGHRISELKWKKTNILFSFSWKFASIKRLCGVHMISHCIPSEAGWMSVDQCTLWKSLDQKVGALSAAARAEGAAAVYQFSSKENSAALTQCNLSAALAALHSTIALSTVLKLNDRALQCVFRDNWDCIEWYCNASKYSTLHWVLLKNIATSFTILTSLAIITR